MIRRSSNEAKNIGFFISFVTILAAANHFIHLYEKGVPLHGIGTLLGILASLSFSFLILLLSFLKGTVADRWNRRIQVTAFLVMGTIYALVDFDSWFGIGLFAMDLMVASKYGYFKKKRLLKLGIFGTYVVILSQYSIYLNQDIRSVAFTVNALLFLLFYFGLMFLCFYDQLNLAATRVERLRREKEILEGTIEKDMRTMEELTKQIASLEKEMNPIDLSPYGISRAEMKVLEALVIYRGTNGEIASRLGKAEDTVKIQLKSIMDKLGAKDRYDVIEICRNNFKSN